MNLENKVKDQMASSPLCGFRNPIPWFASTLAPIVLISAGFLGFGFSALLLISTVWILPFVYFAFSKHRPVVEAESQEEVFGSDQESSTQMEDVVVSEVVKPGGSETQTQTKEAEESASEIYEQYSVSESECLYHLSTSDQGSEVDWPFREDVDQSLDYSDGSISDEESLIEIALPSGQYVGHNYEEKTKDIKQQKVSDFSPESIFQPHTYCLMELLSEINEMNELEDNMIEIDISMGSIKCSRIEIEA